MVHPFTGVDHILAMVAVGLWAAHLGKRAAFALPLVFPAMMLVGGTLANSGVSLPAIEPLIAISVITLGVLIAAQIRFSLIASASLIGLFATFHGYAHISESAGTAVVPYSMGFIASTLVLHLVGVALGILLTTSSTRAVRTGGSFIALAGGLLLLASG